MHDHMSLPADATCAEKLLTVSDSHLVEFLNHNRVEGGGFDISRVTGVDGLSEGQREEFSQRLR